MQSTTGYVRCGTFRTALEAHRKTTDEVFKYEVKNKLIEEFIEMVFLMRDEVYRMKRTFINEKNERCTHLFYLPIAAQSRTKLTSIVDGDNVYRLMYDPHLKPGSGSEQLIELAAHQAACKDVIAHWCPDPVDKSEFLVVVDLHEVRAMYAKWLQLQQLAVLTALIRCGVTKHPLYDRNVIWRAFEAVWPAPSQSGAQATRTETVHRYSVYYY